MASSAYSVVILKIPIEFIALPIIEGAFCRDNDLVHYGFGFGFSSVSHVYKVVRFTKRNPKCNKAEILVLTVGSGIWRSIGKVYGTVKTTNGAFHNGFLHWIFKSERSPSRYIRAFDVESELLKNLPMPPCETIAKKPKLSVLNGALSMTSFSSDTLQVWLMKDSQGKMLRTRELDIHDCCLNRADDVEILKLDTEKDPIEVLLFVDFRLSLYTPATRSLVKVQIDGLPYRAKNICVTVSIFQALFHLDIIKDYSSKHPEEVAETSDIKLHAWTTSVARWGENNESEVVEIPRGQPTPCLPLPEDLKQVSVATTSTLRDMISGRNALLLYKYMVERDEIKRLRKENEEFRATIARVVSRKPDYDAGPS